MDGVGREAGGGRMGGREWGWRDGVWWVGVRVRMGCASEAILHVRWITKPHS